MLAAAGARPAREIQQECKLWLASKQARSRMTLTPTTGEILVILFDSLGVAGVHEWRLPSTLSTTFTHKWHLTINRNVTKPRSTALQLLDREPIYLRRSTTLSPRSIKRLARCSDDDLLGLIVATSRVASLLVVEFSLVPSPQRDALCHPSRDRLLSLFHVSSVAGQVYIDYHD
ncbi:hypothetical protein EVAR_74320_1 [Eumeta japonica]|uniref:Uncharacterized protein n=1 Tax=Eumeta variegata TaxID=151549 RepID=A0A4C1SCR2_EUMVA|nr:hypothetical protein EVAR_74320_1 [Eumeta japonica]